MSGQRLPESDAVEREATMIRRGASSIVERVSEMGEGDLIRGLAKAVGDGTLDVPFPSNNDAAGNVVPIRDDENAVRILDPGSVPVPDDVVQYHEDRIERRVGDVDEVDHEMVADDIKMYAR